MNKTALKNFAMWARRKLIIDITDSAGLLAVNEKGIGEPLQQSKGDLQLFDIGTKDYVEVKGERIAQRNSLCAAIRAKAEELNDYKAAFEFIVEEVAYTWFNRMIAIRFMEVNGYLPIRVLSSESGKHEPDIVTTPFESGIEFKAAESERIYELRDSNKLEELFRMLFIRECNNLHDVLPELFEATNDYTELLLSLSYTDKDGVVYHLVNDISEDDFNIEKEGQIEIIGWMYQYYNTEPKDKVFAALKKNVKITKENIPAATQLFTPDWIVRYMVENSLGRLWIEGHPDADLREGWKYYLDEAEQEPQVQAQLDEIRAEYKKTTPEDIRVIDPCMGSGHILVYAFDVLMQIYTEQGYTERDAAKLIVEKNLWGLDIDKRAYQLAYFAVMMKARQYNRRILTSGIKPNLFVIDDNRALTPEIIAYIADGDSKMAADLRSISDDLTNAREYGSIINVQPVDFNGLIERIEVIAQSDELNLIAMENKRIACEDILPLVKQAQALSQKYDVVCTNPPYMGGSGMNSLLSEYVKKRYSDAKSDLFASFMMKCLEIAKQNGYSSLVTMQSWMFLSSFEEMRTKLLTLNTLTTLMHMENMVMGIAFGTAVSVFRKGAVKGYKGTYNQIKLADIENAKPKSFPVAGNRFAQVSSDNFSKIPGMPVAYWVSKQLFQLFTSYPNLNKVGDLRSGISTGDNEIYYRLWFECLHENISCDAQKTPFNSSYRWFKIIKGGEFRKWYGNRDMVLDLENSCHRIINSGKNYRLRTPDYYTKVGITWSRISSGSAAFRIKDETVNFGENSPCMFLPKNNKYILGLLNSCVVKHILSIINPTMTFQVVDLDKLPVIISDKFKLQIEIMVQDNIEISKTDWDSFETSWDFKTHPLLKPVPLISESFAQWSDECEKRFTQLKSNEEELNRIFIDIYGLQDELTPEVEDKDVTVRRADLTRDIKSLVSYAVGCMFGRYSIYKEGLIFAGEKFSMQTFVDKMNERPGTVSAEEINRAYHNEGINVSEMFAPDPDNCIPVTDEEYFRDDIVVRFVDFIRTVYGADTLEENLTFIADALGTRGNTSRERIRNYFLNDFIKDHIKMYQKRPIYWMFDSGKQNGFKALVYMHRWNADTTGNVRVRYLHKLQRIYENEIRQAQDVIDTGSGREVTAAQKRMDKLTKQLKETHDYDEKIAHLALSRIDIDLDDGVKVNYEKVQTSSDGKKIEVLAKL